MRTLALIRSGIATTIQDTGRSGHQQIGIPPSGAMDKFAMLMGQRHLGHRNNEAALEFAYGDLAFKTSHPCRFVVTGAPAIITIGDATHHSGSLEHTEANQMVDIHTSGHGVYNYLHVAGGIAISTCLGSRSTSPRERIGGLEGRYLRDGDILPLGPESKDYEALDSIMPSTRHRDTLSLRFIPGFQFDQFSETTRQNLISQVFSVTPRANRMGIALSGDPVDTGIEALLSEATCYGAIQIPPDGDPIVLLNDRQTVGGYPKAGAVISGDCHRLVQSRPGQRVRFVAITPQEADRVAWLEHHYLETKLS
jgi:biotin-dependent carboxylase-like uncharacterized protein